MSQTPNSKRPTEPKVITVEISVEEINRVLEVGRLLLSVLTDEEKEELIQLLGTSSKDSEIGNAGVP